MAEITYKPFTLKAALELVSPPTFVASVMPVLVGGVAALALGPLVLDSVVLGPLPLESLARESLTSTPTTSLPVSLLDARIPLVWLLMLVTAVLMQAAVNTLNDYQDFLAGTDTAETILDEHDASIVYNGINPRSALVFGIVLLLCAALSGTAVVLFSDWRLLVVGLAAAAVVVLYSFGPRPISHLPLGELISGIVMGGFITGATYYAMTRGFTPLIYAIIVPPVVTIALIMQTNNTCDIERDIEAGRRTLPLLLGRERSVKLARVLSWATPIWMVLALILATAFFWRSLLLLFVIAVIAVCLYLVLRRRLKRIAAGPYDLVNRGAMMGNITVFCRSVNLLWAGALLIYLLLVQLMLKGMIGAI